MKWLDHLTVRKKLALAFGVVLLLMTALGAAAIVELSRLYSRTDDVLVYKLPGVRDSLRMMGKASLFRQREYRALLSPQQDLPQVLARQAAASDEFAAASKDYEAFIDGDDERRMFQAAMQEWKDYRAQSAEAMRLLQAGQRSQAVDAVMAPAALGRFERMQASMQKLCDYNVEQAREAGTAARAIHERSRWVVAACLAAALACAGWLGWVIARGISAPLGRAVALARSVAGGDLTQRSQPAGADEIATLMRALDDMVVQLRAVVGDVRSGVESVGTASAQIAAGNADLSQRTEEQAANLQQTSASMEQLTAAVQRNADTARAAAQLAAAAVGVAQRGGSVVGDVVTTMDDISASSARIADITGVIDGIAFQTNILALNAAVEAARAGEQGRGFAVVAAEVRALAQRSADAARQIKSLIEHSVAKVGDGARLVGDAGVTMNDIVVQVQRVSDLIGDISAASVEQAQGIGQVGDAVSQLDQVTQQNAALVEQAAAAADSMKHQAQRLARTVAVFRTGGAA